MFPRLFSISNHKDGLVGEILVDRERFCRGAWGWRRRLFVWEEALLQELSVAIPVLALSEEEDEWKWALEDYGCFSVKSTYLLLDRIFTPEPLFGDEQLRVLNLIWKSPAPSKVLAFSWKLLRDRLPSKVNLAKRGVQLNGAVLDCVHCQGREEDVEHLFLCCNFVDGVWKAIFHWLGLVIVIPSSSSSLFDCFIGAAGSKKVRRGFALIWHATVWAIWRSRNNVIFSNGVIDPGEVVEDVKLSSWRWGLSRHKIPTCLYYEWCWDPGLCLRR
ncbi:hypothetical protein QL285_041097 [Trifolium repens]|jgi:hypothetical protein|nr:hypothetical protein QL285_041097 [Trifolium repens]